ncbi:MAG: hypothetical protein Q8S84_09660 [bacterium]|nr:hypothetical protein [bacterium]MDP3381679.1 hypothetical protein [bacterium]
MYFLSTLYFFVIIICFNYLIIFLSKYSIISLSQLKYFLSDFLYINGTHFFSSAIHKSDKTTSNIL